MYRGGAPMKAAASRALRLALVLSCALSLVPRPVSANSITGAWSDILDWPIVAIHMVQLHTGEILIWSSKNEEPHVLYPAGNCFELGNGCFTIKPNPVNIFCAGHTQLDDGTVIVNGGHVRNNVGEAETFLFEYDKNAYEWNWTSVGEIEDTDFARWYPTLTTLPDGRVLNVSGSQKRCNSGPNLGNLCMSHEDCDPAATENCTAVLVGIPELYDPATRMWEQLSLITDSVQFYPFNFVDPNGDLFFAGADKGVSGFDIPPTQSVTYDVANESLTLGNVSLHDGGSAAMYRPGRILKTGGTDAGAAAIADAEIINLNGAAVWQSTDPMNVPRRRHNLTVLADGTVLATGGTRVSNRERDIDRSCGGTNQGALCCRDADCPANVTCQANPSGAQQWVAEAELWNPQTGNWTLMASSQVPRMYHSTAMLLRDGRVVSAGGGRGGCALNNHSNAEIFSPPYLFTGTPAPVITQAPETIFYGQAFEVESPEANDVNRVNLVRLAAVTHSFDQNRRFVPLTFSHQGDTKLAVNPPAGPNIAPPGYYMLFLLSSEGVPSVARFVRILPADPGADASYEYSAKIVCGAQTLQEEVRLAPGHYSTTVNIHNPGPGSARFFKKLALTYPPGEQKAGEVLPIGEHVLGYDEALQSDCPDLRRRLIPGGTAPLIEGFLVIQSDQSLDVTAVYTTAAIDGSGNPTTHTSVDIEQVKERARGSDLRVTKSVEPFPFPLNDNFTLVLLLYTIDVDNGGPENALNLRIADEVTLEVAPTGAGIVGVLDQPIILPPGGQILNITPPGLSVSFDLELGDLAVGDSLQVRFWALAYLYRANALVRNVATAEADGPDLTPMNSTAKVEAVIP